MLKRTKAAPLGTILAVCCAAILHGSRPASSAGPASRSLPASAQGAVVGNSLPGAWRPFSDSSPWNTPIASDAPTHPDSGVIMGMLRKDYSNLRLPNIFSSPIWVVDSGTIPPVPVKSSTIYDTWDRDQDGWSDVGAPITRDMFRE